MARPKSPLSHFIESLPSTLPVKEVVRRASDAGFTTSESNVQRVRNLARKGGKKAPASSAKKAPAKPAAKAAVAAPSKSPASEVALRKLALEIGLGRAEAVLADLRTRLAKLF